MQKTLGLDRLDSPLGPLQVVTDNSALCALDYADYESRMLQLLKRRHPGAELRETACVPSISDRLTAYWDGDLKAIEDLAVDSGGTVFQETVWIALRGIPPGRTMTYGGLAARLGKPAASRAVGLANGLNPIAIVIPCHRLIGANGSLTGYAGGLERKDWLLRHEGAIRR